MRVNLADWGVGPTGAGLLSHIPTTPTTSDEQMLANARASLKRGLPVIRPCDPHDHVLSIAAGGPSLADTWEQISGVTVAVNGSLGFLRDRGVTPWGVGVMDPGLQMKDIVPRVDGTHYFIASICDQTLFDHLSGLDVGVWHPGGCPGLKDVLTEERGTNWTMVAGGSTMGVRWLNLGYTLGFRKFEFHGLDSSYRGDGATHAYPDHTDGADHLIIDGYRTKLAFVRQVSDFFAILDAFSGPQVDPITIEVHGTGWLQDRWRQFRELNPTAFKPIEHTAETERSKYERMWSEDDYRNSSPGERLVPMAIETLGIDSGDRVIDFGCGPARATQALADFGCDVLGIDIAENCRDPGIDTPLRIAVLWDLPDDIEPADFGLCCDVMEHIPAERVGAVLAGIRRLTKRGAFFNIAFAHDLFGELIGERLHLTVRSEAWWKAKLSEHWGTVESMASFDPKYRGVFVVRP